MQQYVITLPQSVGILGVVQLFVHDKVMRFSAPLSTTSTLTLLAFWPYALSMRKTAEPLEYFAGSSRTSWKADLGRQPRYIQLQQKNVERDT